MWRNLHSIFGLAAAVLLTVLSVSGAVLATLPLADTLRPEAQTLAGYSVADAIEIALLHNKKLEIERIKVAPSGAVLISGRQYGRGIKSNLNLQTGKLAKEEKLHPVYAIMRDFHRSLLLGFVGRSVVFVGAVIMCILCLSGIFVLVRRMGGWRLLFSPIKGRWPERLHVLFSRLFILPLVITSVSGAYLGAVTMGFVPSGNEVPPAYPESLQELDPVLPYELDGLKQLALNDVREIIFPIPEDWFDVFAVKTHDSNLFFDQFTGELLSSQPCSFAQRIFDLFTLLHTAEGLAPWGIVAGIAVVSVPAFALTGFVIWLNRMRSGMGRIRNNSAAKDAEIVILVGSENGSTWGFGKALHAALAAAGAIVHIRAINDMRAAYPNGRHLIVLAATYGDGEAPQNANRFVKRLRDLNAHHLMRFCVLGFGDKSFPRYCAFAQEVDQALRASGRNSILELADVDRKSAQSFSRWGHELAEALNLDFELDYSPPKPRTYQLALQNKEVFGAQLQAPTAVLRFCPIAGENGCDFVPTHNAGDLVSIYPKGDARARMYSVGSCAREKCLEICVARQDGGVCSTYLNNLALGERIEFHIEQNADFHMPTKGRKPVIMIGAGTGIAPFAGMIRNNMKHVPVDLYWGNRDPSVDHLYGTQIPKWLAGKFLKNFYPAFSRVEGGGYVQDRVREQAHNIVHQIRSGATIMVCGGAKMAQGVRHELEIIAVEAGSSIAELKRSGRYREDTY
ncbi:PepSY domain-containing protein [Maritalea porphyrae]|uniref:PepSY domain-containing protein n=1 Tax=Maritalea porphyrae TaxID=880732 RepID=UPI0022AE56D2|nr:PepSY domain-containing protein [Maritalea porphyrae]MCZ4272515.1 PepSY domain-containing protein [Maritalea porphyrae]